MVAQVLVQTKQIDKTFTYLVPKELETKIQVGVRCLVPFSNRKLEGFVLDLRLDFTGNYELKEMISLVDEEPVLNSEMLELGKYLSKKTLCTLIQAYQAMLPSALKAKEGFTINKKIVSYLHLKKEVIPKTDKQKELLDLFLNDGDVLKSEANNVSSYWVTKYLNLDVLEEIKKEEYRLQEKVIESENRPILTNDQKGIISNISLDSFSPYLLHGVTGSGKTEVYMNLIEKTLDLNKAALVLVPEISLTPQLVTTFKKRFGDNIALLHSSLSEGEKYDEWRKIKRGEARIVIGARSAVFAPLTNIGIIIIDEEHSGTYKQENIPRYNAIDMAIYRAKTYNSPIVLGSATPSIESYTRAKMGIYKLLELKNRINNNLPKVTLIDMKDEIKKGNRVFSKLLKTKINECLNKNEQIILLLNRRGYTTIVTCKNCGFTQKCKFCDIPLTYHKSNHKMQCHYCDRHDTKLTVCPVCHSQDINEYGMGTEKLEQLVTLEFPNSRVIRMDNDTTRTKSSHEKIIKSFQNEEYNILIGTQMIAKGLDFPKVTLVGVINGDFSLNIPDFRSGERTFGLLSQVAGRAGRSDLKGEVIIQGFNIDNYSIVKASNHDYIGFYEEEMKIRKQLKYPPYYNLAVIKMQSRDYDFLTKEAAKIGEYLRNNTTEAVVLGPASDLIPRINNVYYMNTIIKYRDTKKVINVFNDIIVKYRGNNKILVSIDLNN